jgi:hypothetical protein
LVDASTDHESVTAADRVDATFQEQLRAGDDRREEAARRCGCKSGSRVGRAVEIVFPGLGFRR